MKKNIILLISSIILSLILAEVILRLHYSHNFPDIQTLDRSLPKPKSHVDLGDMILFHPNKYISYQMKPGLDVYFKGVKVKTNSRGHREGELPLYKDGSINIIGIGDSYMFGWKVNESQRYMDILEGLLNERFPENQWRTYVMAVPGYNLLMASESLKESFDEVNPDIVVYGYCGNDHCLPNIIHNGYSNGLKPIIIDYFQFGVSKVMKIDDRDILEICNINETDNLDSEFRDMVGYENYRRNLLDLGDFTEKRGVPLVVFYFHKVPDNMIIEHPNIHYIVSELNFMDLVISDDDWHLSVKGNEMMAEVLLDGMVEKGLVG